MTLTLEDIRIPNPTQKLILQTIKTLPVSPDQFRFELSADGIEKHYLGNKDKKEYREKCLAGNIIPNTKLEFEYDFHKHLFFPAGSGFAIQCPEVNPLLAAQDAEALIMGGRIHEIKVNYGGSFTNFRDDFMRKLLEQGYQFRTGEIWFNHTHLTEYNQGDYFNTGIQFWMPNEFKFVMGDARDIPEEKMNNLAGWFNDMKEMHLGQRFF